MYKFSVVIPSYNISGFHQDFFKSMDYISTSVDVIFINDCSTDSTQELIENFIKDKPNMRLFNHLKNTKQGGALNTGIKNMKTKWYFRIDPDDMIRKDYEKYITKAIEQNPDAYLIRFKFYFKTSQGIKKPNIVKALYFKMAFGWSCGFNIEKFGIPKYKEYFKMEDMEMFGRQFSDKKYDQIFINKYLINYTIQRKNSTMNSIDLNTIENWEYALKKYNNNKNIKGWRTYLYKKIVSKRISKYKRNHEKNKSKLD